MWKLFSYDGIVKCRQNLNFENMDAAPYTGKNDGVSLLWGKFKDYLKQNIIVEKQMLIQLSFADW